MDKTVLKNFAIESKKDLMDRIDRKIKLLYVDQEFKKEIRGDIIVLSNDKQTITLTKKDNENREKLIRRIVELGYNQVVEEAAYTWFNRIIALRYMELHDFLPLSANNQSLGVRVLSSNDNTPNPEILKFSVLSNKDLDINFDSNYYSNLVSDDEKYKYILLLICNKMSKIIPQVFGGITDYIDLLIPDNMLNDNGFIYNLIKVIKVTDFDQVEIIGWLYQYYNQTEKDKTMAKKGAYDKNEVPYVTQLFTPDWIVKYMVDNSLGRYYVEHFNDTNIKNELKYLIKDNILESKEQVNIENIRFLDPCSGSGHILVYAFELFYKMYLECGYSKNDIVDKILRNNIYGLDVDDRAGQLSILSIILKAREYDKNIFNKEIIRNLNICSIKESNNVDTTFFDKNIINKNNINYLIDTFINAKEIGSLLKVEEKDYSNVINDFNKDIIGMSFLEQIKPLIKQSILLSNKYDIVVTNPPYLALNKMNTRLKKYISTYYSDSKSDLCNAFMENDLVKENGYLSMINQHSWMFLGSCEKLRLKLINNYNLNSMIHLGTRAFEEIGGEVVQTTSFVFQKIKTDKDSIFVSVIDIDKPSEKETKFLEYINDKKIIYKKTSEFEKLPGYTFAYWASDNIGNIYKNSKKISDYGTACVGLQTSDNNRFLRKWFEVDISKIGFGIKSIEESVLSGKKWFPYNKGGGFRRWYGNNDNIVNWENDGYEIRQYNEFLNSSRTSNIGIANTNFYFKESGTWGLVSNNFSVRYSPIGSIFDTGGSSFFSNINLKYIIGFCNTKIAQMLLLVQNPTINFQPGNVANLPLIVNEEKKKVIESIVDDNIGIAKDDWDSYETSYDFKRNPLLQEGIKSSLINISIENWNKYLDQQKTKLIQNESKLNEEFIDIYGLENEANSTINENELSISEKNITRDIKLLINYSVGCMFGRYSLDEDGLIYSGGVFDKNRYITFSPDSDNIIPISDSENVYYNDDIVGKFKEFIKAAFGIETFNKNIDYIAEVLGKKGTESTEETLRRYFVNDFYEDHIKIYQKRPIYWLFDSGKKNGFKCLVYLHRYDEQLVSKIRTKYLHNTLSIYQRTNEEIDYKLNNEELSTSEKRELQNKKADLNGKITECNEYEEMVGNVASKMIKLDLDDGVAVNYAKFVDDNGKSILAKIK